MENNPNSVNIVNSGAPNQMNLPQTNIHKSRYSVFFLVMLILSSISSFFSFFGIFINIFSGISEINNNMLAEAIIKFASIPVAVIGIVALALLYMKKKAGFMMKVSFIALSMVISVASVVATRDSSVASFMSGFNRGANPTTLEEQDFRDNLGGFMNQNGGNIIIAVGIIFSLVYYSISLLLWLFAWRSQLKHDELENQQGSHASIGNNSDGDNSGNGQPSGQQPPVANN